MLQFVSLFYSSYAGNDATILSTEKGTYFNIENYNFSSS
jgi:hypothetical protein